MKLFEVREFIKTAIKDEETGLAFYTALAEVSENEQVSQKLKSIAQEEVGHKKRFQEMLEEIGDYHPGEHYEGEYENYVNALFEEKKFPTPDEAEKKARTAESTVEALDIAKTLEKDTILFLSEMKNFIPDDYTGYIDEIISEEQKHLLDLNKLEDSL